MSKISGITTVCFDIDWTLIRHCENQERELLRKLDLKPNIDFENQVHYFWNNVHKRLQNGQKVEKSMFYGLAEEMIPFLKMIDLSGEEWYKLLCEVDDPKLIDGAYEILQHLQNQGYYIVACSNAFVSEQAKILKDLEVLDFFERVYGWDTICAKPHCNALYSLMTTHSRDSMIFIGDSVYTDINFANRIGIKSIGCNLQYSKGEEHIKPTVNVSSLLEIKNIL